MKEKKEKKQKITTIGTSNYIIVPYEYVSVFNLEGVYYKLEVLDDGATLIYRRVTEEESKENEEEIIKQ